MTEADSSRTRPSRLSVALALATLGAAGAVQDVRAETPAVAVVCLAGPGVDAGDAETVCAEALDAFRAALPDHELTLAETLPQLRLTVTQFSTAGVGLDLTFVGADGAETAGKPLQLSVSDRTASPSLRRGFYLRFIALNPLPF